MSKKYLGIDNINKPAFDAIVPKVNEAIESGDITIPEQYEIVDVTDYYNNQGQGTRKITEVIFNKIKSLYPNVILKVRNYAFTPGSDTVFEVYFYPSKCDRDDGDSAIFASPLTGWQESEVDYYGNATLTLPLYEFNEYTKLSLYKVKITVNVDTGSKLYLHNLYLSGGSSPYSDLNITLVNKRATSYTSIGTALDGCVYALAISGGYEGENFNLIHVISDSYGNGYKLVFKDFTTGNETLVSATPYTLEGDDVSNY